MQQSVQRIVWSLAASLAVAAPVFAESVSFDYNVQTKQGVNPADGVGIPGVLNTVTFDLAGQGTATAGTMTVYYYPALTNAYFAPPNSFLHEPIWVNVTLTDNAAQPGAGSVKSGVIAFTGTLSSIFAVSNGVFDFWNYVWTESTQSITLGSPGQFHTYTVSAPTYYSDNSGVVAGNIAIEVNDYQPGVGPAPVAPASEPASLLLAGLAVPPWFLFRRWRYTRSTGGRV